MSITNRGSEWSKWDLHIHTPASIYQRFGNDDIETWEKYITDLESLPKNFKLIGINDYLFLNGYERLKKEQTENGRLPNLKLLPVVEFRIKMFAGIEFGSLKRINLHVIFSDEISLETIQSQFLNTIEQSYQLESGDKWTRAITRQSVEDLGKQIKAGVPAEQLDKYGSDLTEGFNNLNVNEEKIFESLTKDCFKDKVLIAIGKTEWGDLKWTDASIGTKKSIINLADIVFTASESIDAFNRAKQQLFTQGVNDVLLDCSDAHYFSTSTDKDRIGNCNNWIKANPTFEGLKQIIFEPEQRLKVQIGEPDFKEEKLVIDEIRFVSSDDTFTPAPIRLNKNLNVIIGGKSSGKSILLFNIARTLLNDRSNTSPLKFRDSDDGNYKYLYDFDKSDSQFDFHVVLKSGSQQSILRGDNEPSILADVKYIPQNHLSNLVDRSRTQGNTLKELIRNLILEAESYHVIYKDFVAKAKLNDSARDRLIEDYFQIQDKIAAQQQEVMAKGDQAALNDSILKNQQQIQRLNKESGLSPEQIGEYDRYNIELNEMVIRDGKVKNDQRKLKAFHDELTRALSELELKKQQVLGGIETDTIREEFNLKYGVIASTISSLTETGKLFEVNETSNLIAESTIREELNSNHSRIKELEELLKPFKASQESKVQIAALEQSIQEDNHRLNAIKQIISEIETNRQNLQLKKDSIFVAFEENFQEYEKVISALDPRVKSIEGEDDKLEIQGLIKYNFPKFRTTLEDMTDLRSFDGKSLSIYSKTKTALSTFTYSEIIEQLKVLFENIITGTHPLKRGISKADASKKIFIDHFFDHWEVTSEGDTIHNMSTGKASFVLLKLIIKLSNAKAPILIDQPEDNLDNRSVSNDLVIYLREKKLERQIILVTHNPNIVVNADAENIIVANQKGQNDTESSSPYKFDYINGALEETFPKNDEEKDLLKCMGIREHIADIVEGGKEAFKKREKKYGF